MMTMADSNIWYRMHKKFYLEKLQVKRKLEQGQKNMLPSYALYKSTEGRVILCDFYLKKFHY